jgi:hypothetical protein
MKRLISLILFFLITTLGYSQYKVQMSNGALLETDTGYTKLKIGQKLDIGSKIFLNGSLYLLDSESKSHEITEKGIYTLDTLISSKKDNISRMYIDYIVQNMGKKEQRMDMSLTGSVERSTSKYTIETYYPERSYIQDRIEIYWKPVDSVKRYKVSVYSMFDVEVVSADVKDTSFVLYMNQLLSPDQVYILKISDKKGEFSSKPILLECPNEINKHLMDKEIHEFNSQSDTDYMYYYILGKKYEENGYHFNAIENYKRSLRLKHTPMVKTELLKY